MLPLHAASIGTLAAILVLGSCGKVVVGQVNIDDANGTTRLVALQFEGGLNVLNDIVTPTPLVGQEHPQHPVSKSEIDESDSGEVRKETVEECLMNRAQLVQDAVSRLLRERRKLAQAIKKINRQQGMFCRVDEEGEQIPYRKCPGWRNQKWTHYHQLIRITYCSDPSRWPDAPSIESELFDEIH